MDALARRLFNLRDAGAVDSWLHDVRQHWRRRQWTALRGRRLEFTGIDRGVDVASVALLRALEGREEKDEQVLPPAMRKRLADQLGGDRGVRTFLGLLRRVHAGGVAARDRRYRQTRKGERDPANAECSYGHPCETVMHLLWECPLGELERQPAMDILTRWGVTWDQLPICFKYALLWPDGGDPACPASSPPWRSSQKSR